MYPGGVGVTGKSTVTESPATIVPAYGFAVEQVRLSGSFTLTVKAPAFTNWRVLPFTSVYACGAPPLTVTSRPCTPLSPMSWTRFEFASMNTLLITYPPAWLVSAKERVTPGPIARLKLSGELKFPKGEFGVCFST